MKIVAPMVKVGEIHSQANSPTYFYVFEYQSKVSDYAQVSVIRRNVITMLPPLDSMCLSM